MDGVIYHGHRLLDGAKPFVAWLKAEDTYCALLQKRFPEWKIDAFAIEGYSTFQNLLIHLVENPPFIGIDREVM